MSNKAEENKQMCDEMLSHLADGTGFPQGRRFTVSYRTLIHRTIASKDQEALEGAMNWLTGSFEFEATELFIENAFGYEITLPNIIHEFYEEGE